MTKKNSQGFFILDKLEQKGDGSLLIFMKKMMEFDRRFCEVMASGNEFTVRIEVKGDKGKVIHCRVYNDEIERPSKEKDPK